MAERLNSENDETAAVAMQQRTSAAVIADVRHQGEYYVRSSITILGKTLLDRGSGTAGKLDSI